MLLLYIYVSSILHLRNEKKYFNKKSKLRELEEECRVLSNVMKSLEASEQEAKQREENFAELMREYTDELKEVNSHALCLYLHLNQFYSHSGRRKS